MFEMLATPLSHGLENQLMVMTCHKIWALGHTSLEAQERNPSRKI